MFECVHQVLGQILRTAEIDMANSVAPNDVDVFLDNAAWAICSTYHTVLKASPGAAIFGRNMLFNIPFMSSTEHGPLLRWWFIPRMNSTVVCGAS
jgi:hypothetical protein